MTRSTVCKRLLSLGLALACMMTVSCGKHTDDSTATDSSESVAVGTSAPTPELPETILTLVKDGQTDFTIVYPEGAQNALIREVNTLVSLIRSYTGATIFHADDFTRESAEELSAKCEILIGATNRAESQKWIGRHLGNGEYVVAVEGNKLILGGPTESDSVRAIRYFMQQVLKQDESLTEGTENGTLTVSSAINYTYEKSYVVSEMTVGGTPISEFTIVVPKYGYVEEYIGKLLMQYIATYEGSRLPLLTEDEADGIAHAIRIGATKKSVTKPTAGQYTVAVTGTDLEIVSDSVFGYAEACFALQSTILKPTNKQVTLQTGETWSGHDAKPEALTKSGEIRVMYHNIWGYLNSDGSNPIAMRADIAIPIYEAIAPDILCLEEAGSVFRTGARALFASLKTNGYAEICDTQNGGTGNPIFYRKDVLELVEEGYAKARNGDKGTTWAVFRLKSDPTKLFAVTNSHFAANSNAGGDASLGNSYRVQDAKAAASAVTAILTKYGDIPVFTGGDFNTAPGTEPYTVLTKLGMKNVLALTDRASTVKPYHGSYAYDADYDLYDLQIASVPGTSGSSIDHIMALPNGATVRQYHVMDDMLSATVSDHCPHYADIDF